MITATVVLFAWSPATPRSAEAVAGTPADSISAGGDNTCLVKDGGAWCQGRNGYGQLGIGTNTGPQPNCVSNNSCSYIPVAVSGMASGVSAIGVGGNHACAIRSGAVWCWGHNAHGQLGNNSTLDQYAPFKVPDNAGTGFTNSGVAGISAGEDHTCALTTAAVVWCWGLNGSGQLGNNSTTESHVPYKVPDSAITGFTNTGVSAIAAGANETCALTGGVAWCWGNNAWGGLGNGTTTNSLVPLRIPDNAGTGFTNSNFSAIAPGLYHVCAVQNGSAWCWGSNGSGQLGDNSSAYSYVPVKAFDNASAGFANSGVTAISASTRSLASVTTYGDFSCAVKSGSVWCWGDNYLGQLGNNSTVYSPLPVAVSGLTSGVTAITSGGIATCSLAGGVWCWGYNASGQVGNSATDNCPSNNSACSLTPVPVAAPGVATGVGVIAGGANDTCALKDTGASCWGNNQYNELGNGSSTPSSVAAAVHSLGSGVSAIAVGLYHACAVQNGSAWCWGADGSGQLGDFGNNSNGSAVPVKVFDNASASFTNAGVTAVSAGSRSHASVTTLGDFSCAVRNGGVWCWGDNGNGQLGINGTVAQTPYSTLPLQVTGLTSGVTAISSGGYHTCALTVAGGVWCWGLNSSGQVGSNAASTCSYGSCSLVPVPVPGLASGVAAISAGGEETCALTLAGSVLCWGSNQYGQLGANFPTNSSTPVPVPGLGSGVTAIGVGGNHACAVQNGGARCWGFNNKGQLGDNSVLNQHAPFTVPDLASGVAAIPGAMIAGENHTCALTTAGIVWCWGYNINGQVGNDTNTDSLIPVAVLGLPHPAPPSVLGPTIQVGAPSLATVTVRVPVNAWGTGFGAYTGFSLHLRWVPSVFTFSAVDTTGTVINSPYCPPAVIDGDGGGVTFACATEGASTTATGLLATIVLTPKNMGCSTVHLVTLGAPDSGDSTTGSYTIDATATWPQANGYGDSSVGWAGQSPCAQDSSGNGYSDAQVIALGKNPLLYCPIMRADINGDHVVNGLDLAMLASSFLLNVPPANPRIDQNFDYKINGLDLARMASVFLQNVTGCP